MGRSYVNENFFSYLWPGICGLLIAVIVWLVAPGFLAPQDKPGLIESSSSELVFDGLSGPVSYAPAATRAGASVVNIYTSKTVAVRPTPLASDPIFQGYFNSLNQRQPETKEERNLGSGVVVSREGYVLTNEHVIAGADRILVALSDGRTSPAEIVGVDNVTDLAVLKVQLDNLSAIGIGDPNSAEVGDVVLAIGNPLGFSQTVTQGILSAKGRNLIDMDTYVNVNFLQTDAAINQGNSGGPLVDIHGNMIGINSRTFQNDGSFGLSFAIPADIVLKVFRDILEHGKVIRGWLGVEADSLRLSDEASNFYGFDQALGVKGLYPGGPAHRAGMEVGDLILKINGQEIGNGRRTSKIIADTPPGKKIDFEILRGNQSMLLTVLVGLRPGETIN